MQAAIKNTLQAVPPYALFLFGFASVVAFGLVRLHGLLQAAIG
jgi:hypothetical protein